jgi:hypothetical protein
MDNPKQLVIVYQAYGPSELSFQVLYSLYSLEQHSEPSQLAATSILIFSDQPDVLRTYIGANRPWVEIVPITAEQITDWQGPNRFVHRAKIKIIQTAWQGIPGPLLYLDGDTYFKASPWSMLAQLSPSDSWMHENEGTLAEGKHRLHQKIARYVRNKSFTAYDGQSFSIPLNTAMCNAGVIAMHQHCQAYLAEVLALSDQLFAGYPKHVMEQLSFSYWLQAIGKVHDSTPYIYHYWKEKRLMNEQLTSVFADATDFDAAIPLLKDLTPPDQLSTAAAAKKRKAWYLFWR